MNLNVPNMMTLARLMLLPVVVGLIWPGVETRHTAFWASIVYLVAGIMDVIDGAIARHMQQVTALGKFLDPLADKLFYLVTLIALLQLPGSWIPPWVVMVSLARELAITGLRGIAAGEGIVIAAGEGGKIKTTFATAGMCALLVHYPYAIHLGWISFVLDAHLLGLAFTFISVGFSLTSAVGYTWDFVRAMKQRGTQA